MNRYSDLPVLQISTIPYHTNKGGGGGGGGVGVPFVTKQHRGTISSNIVIGRLI